MATPSATARISASRRGAARTARPTASAPGTYSAKPTTVCTSSAEAARTPVRTSGSRPPRSQYSAAHSTQHRNSAMPQENAVPTVNLSSEKATDAEL